MSKKVLGIIPARSGSKGLPGKNIKMLNGKKLVKWTLEQAKQSKLLSKIVVTTDCPEVASMAKELGLEVPFTRPEHLATDTASSIDVVNHVLEYCDKQGLSFDYIMLMEPTSPLREESDIDDMILKLTHNEQDGHNGVIAVGEAHHPCILKVKKGKQLLPYNEEISSSSRRQEMEKIYYPYGVGYLVKTEAFRKYQTFYPPMILHHELKRYQWYEIDDLYDFLAIENIMKHEWS